MMSPLAVTVISFLGTSVQWLADIILIVIALTFVRRHRPEAALLIAGAAGLDLFGGLAAWAAYYVGARFMSPWPSFSSPTGSTGIDPFSAYYSAVSLASTLVSVLSKTMLIVGVVRLARPARLVPHDPGRYE